MEKIHIVMDKLDVRELCLDVTHEYSKDKTKVEVIENDLTKDIIVTVERDTYIDKIYGREIQGNYYFARHEFIRKGLPDIDYYDEFFSNGIVLC